MQRCTEAVSEKKEEGDAGLAPADAARKLSLYSLVKMQKPQHADPHS
jgi:hypothetical protein